MSSSHYEIKRVEGKNDPTLDEAHALASIDDPHVSTAMEILAERESRPSLIVIERPRGETLEHRGTLPPARAVHVAIQIAHALHAAHQAGVIHRNVRPKNVMLVRTAVDDAFVKLTGFGKAPRKKHDRFVPPEGNTKKVSGVHTDVFGVGACLDKMLGPSERRDPALARIVARATATDPKDRHATAGDLEAALRAWSTGGSAARRDPAWYVLGTLCAIGVGLIMFNERPAQRPMTRPLLSEAHAATVPKNVGVTSGAAGTTGTATDDSQVEIGPPTADSISAPPSAPPESAPPNAAIAIAPAVRPIDRAPSYQAPSGTFYVDEPLRYVSASEGESWRVATTKKVAQCAETHGTGDCALSSMQLSCTIDRYGLVHCSRVSGFDKAGKSCAAPQAFEDCVGRAASGLVSKPKFDRADVQLAEMKYWIRKAR